MEFFGAGGRIEIRVVGECEGGEGGFYFSGGAGWGEVQEGVVVDLGVPFWEWHQEMTRRCVPN